MVIKLKAMEWSAELSSEWADSIHSSRAVFSVTALYTCVENASTMRKTEPSSVKRFEPKRIEGVEVVYTDSAEIYCRLLMESIS